MTIYEPYMVIHGPHVAMYGPDMTIHGPHVAMYGPYMTIYGHVWSIYNLHVGWVMCGGVGCVCEWDEEDLVGMSAR